MEEEEYYTIPTFGLLMLIFSILLGIKIGWVTDDFTLKLSLFGLFASVVFYDLFPIKIKKRKK
jgi:hypothetical protein